MATKKKAISFRAESNLIDEARGAVIAIQENDPSFSRDRLCARGLELAIVEARQLHNGGLPFEACAALKAGRRRATG